MSTKNAAKMKSSDRDFWKLLDSLEKNLTDMALLTQLQDCVTSYYAAHGAKKSERIGVLLADISIACNGTQYALVNDVAALKAIGEATK